MERALRRDPDAVKQPDRCGTLPLHLGMGCTAPVESVAAVLAAHQLDIDGLYGDGEDVAVAA